MNFEHIHSLCEIFVYEINPVGSEENESLWPFYQTDRSCTFPMDPQARLLVYHLVRGWLVGRSVVVVGLPFKIP